MTRGGGAALPGAAGSWTAFAAWAVVSVGVVVSVGLALVVVGRRDAWFPGPVVARRGGGGGAL
ncbi:hypothetical protein Kpho02_62390 [Kitasatospora phosalacinea]|uniref:Uncharacterized protein n=1 Tax=Kitasatospora phosalacinea TaxID=2065 RepID=A0A9W6QFC8_9ACTN|nr:hypothetical protein Kpho02_62390 [Kitasatospora phosalacinea]